MSFVNQDSVPVTLADGRTVAVGDSVTKIDKADQRHVDAGRLVEAPSKRRRSGQKAQED